MKRSVALVLAGLSLVLWLNCKSAPEVKQAAEQEAAPAAVAAEAKPGFEIVVKQTQPVNALCVEHIGPYAVTGKLIESLFAYIAQKTIKVTGNPFGVFYDDPAHTPADQLKSDICVPIEGVPEISEPTKVKSIPPQKVASAVFAGPYSEIAKDFHLVFEWMAKNEWNPAGPVFEHYLDDPSKVKPEDLKTEVWFPISK